MSAFASLCRGGVMLAVATCGLVTGGPVSASALASAPNGAAGSSVASKTAISHLSWRSVEPAETARALATNAARGVTYAGSTSADDPIVIMLSRDGTSVRRISTRFEATCTDGQEFRFLVDGPTNRAITAGGRFAAAGSDTDELESAVTARKTISLKAKVKGKKVTGSQDLHVEKVDGAGTVLATCDQTASFTAISARGRVFGGHTSQNGPVVIELNARRTVVRHFHIGWQSSCTSGAINTGETLINFPLARGRFGDDFTWTNSLPTGETETLGYSLEGKIKRARVTGTFRVKATESDATGAPLATCDTGAISYTASSG